MDAARYAKVFIFSTALVPLVLMIWDGAHGRLGANPIEFITRTTGTMTLVFLSLTLAVTPARKLFGLAWLGKVRRMLGLFAFFYAALHFLTYVWLDQFFDVGAIVSDALSRPFIAIGLIAFGLMVPLAWTSTNRALKRLGGARWRKLHRFTYHVSILGVAHYWLLVKADLTGPITYAVIVGGLLAYRLVAFLKKQPAATGAATPPDSP